MIASHKDILKCDYQFNTYKTLAEYKAQVTSLYGPMCTYRRWSRTQDTHVYQKLICSCNSYYIHIYVKGLGTYRKICLNNT